MTLIELYDDSPLKNIVGALSMRADKVYFVGPVHPMLDDIGRVETVLREKLPGIIVRKCTVSPNNADDIHNTIESIIKKEHDCILETTGGNERLLLIAHELAKANGLQTQHYDIPTGTVADTDRDGKLVPTAPISLSLENILTLYGGKTISATSAPSCSKDMVEKLWEITRRDPVTWNEHLKNLLALEKGHRQNLTVTMPTTSNDDKQEKLDTVLETFQEHHIIHNKRESPQTICYTYADPHCRRVLSKEGNILEHKAFYEAKNAKYQGKPLFDEHHMGAKIEWVSDQTSNEVDLLLRRGIVPLFVSCKNGSVVKEDLYELDVVALRFGGEYAKKMLIATKLDDDQDALIHRAKAMGIHLVKNAGALSSDDWTKEYLKALGYIPAT